MKNIKRVFWGLLIALTALWLVADPVFLAQYQFFALRASLINYTGIKAIGVMSVAMILAVRPVFSNGGFKSEVQRRYDESVSVP